MDARIVLPTLTSILALRSRSLLFDQWRARRGGFQLIWAFGMLFYGIGSGLRGDRRRERLERGALPDLVPDRRGLDRRLARARDGGPARADAVRLQLRALPVPGRPVHVPRPEQARVPGAGTLPLLYLIAAAILALAVAVETYFQNDRWPMLAVGAVVGATVLSIVLMAEDRRCRPRATRSTRRPACRSPRLLPPQLRLLTPFMNITGAFALILGAIFSAYVFMPKRRVLAYSLDPNQPGDEFLFNLLDRAGGDHRQPRRVAAGRAPGAGHRPHPQPRAGDDPDRDRGGRRDRRHPEPVRGDRPVPVRQVRRA